jgi:hypothetical protein
MCSVSKPRYALLTKKNLKMLDPVLKQRYSALHSGFDRYAFKELFEDRFRNPWPYLDAIGIDKICDFVLDGFPPQYIASEIGLPQRTILKWIEADGERAQAYAWALNANADNLMYEGLDIIDGVAEEQAAISKASKQIEHRRHMASGFGAKRWGKKIDVNQNQTASVTYNFNIALSEGQQEKLINDQRSRPLSAENVADVLDLNSLVGVDLSKVPLSVPGETLSYEEAEAIEKPPHE